MTTTTDQTIARLEAELEAVANERLALLEKAEDAFRAFERFRGETFSDDYYRLLDRHHSLQLQVQDLELKLGRIEEAIWLQKQ